MLCIKQEIDITMEGYQKHDDQEGGSSPEPFIHMSSVTNENWRGKNDPTERRRIQNRLNQRAFRQRQRAGESPKQYKPRKRSGETSGHTSATEDDEAPSPSGSASTSDLADSGPSGATDARGYVWDELAQLINRNLMTAASSNVCALGIDAASLQDGSPILTPTPTRSQSIPVALQAVQLQHQVPHDPIIDAIPHPRLRFNILRAIAARQLDDTAFSIFLRASGSLVEIEGQWLREGLVVWSTPTELSSWEISELFVRRWPFLLQGCESLLTAANAWRGRRGEKLLPTSLEATLH